MGSHKAFQRHAHHIDGSNESYMEVFRKSIFLKRCYKYLKSMKHALRFYAFYSFNHHILFTVKQYGHAFFSSDAIHFTSECYNELFQK